MLAHTCLRVGVQMTSVWAADSRGLESAQSLGTLEPYRISSITRGLSGPSVSIPHCHWLCPLPAESHHHAPYLQQPPVCEPHQGWMGSWDRGGTITCNRPSLVQQMGACRITAPLQVRQQMPGADLSSSSVHCGPPHPPMPCR
jgi:hypothetical protein